MYAAAMVAAQLNSNSGRECLFGAKLKCAL